MVLSEKEKQQRKAQLLREIFEELKEFFLEGQRGEHHEPTT